MRLRARWGVLAATILAAGPAPQVIVAAHVSQKNNRPDLVERALLPHVPPVTRFLQATPLGAPELRLPLGPRPVAAPRQLPLFPPMEGSAS